MAGAELGLTRIDAAHELRRGAVHRETHGSVLIGAQLELAARTQHGLVAAHAELGTVLGGQQSGAERTRTMALAMPLRPAPPPPA